MKASRNLAVAVGVAAVISVLVAAQLAQARPTAARTSASPAASGCSLGANGNPVKHVIYLQFDNVHYRRDAAGVPSDLEQMPHLLNFLQGNGTLMTNDHTILISHTAGGILSSLTGDYPDRNGQTVTNSYGFFKPDGTIGFSSAFKYWTDQVDATFDPLPNMITDGQKTTPAPWVPFTRAGCDVGGVGTANIELENTATNATGDMTSVFGANSPEWNEAAAAAALPSDAAHAKAKGQPQTDFVGIAVHCAQTSTSVCANNADARPDALPDEPGGYSGFQALFGAKYVDPAITAHQPCVPDTAGQPITDPAGTCGFPGFDGMLATQHARLRRADAGERRARHLRLHLGRARRPRAEPRHRLVREHGDRAGRGCTRGAAEGLRRRLRRVLPEPRRARHRQEQHPVRDHRRRGRSLHRRRGHPAAGWLACSTPTRRVRRSTPARRTRSAR